MAESDQTEPPAPAEAPKDRRAYLEEQIARQKRGEPVDVAWAKSELARIRAEQARVGAAMQRNLRLVVIMCAAMLLILWFKQGAFDSRGGVWTLGLILIGGLAAWVLGNRRR
jgi:hypothetical protein